jgi:1-acyl-sn-glycerol-3-phosphate acyltransferase
MTMSEVPVQSAKADARPRRHKHVPEIRVEVIQRSHRILSSLTKSYFRSEVRGKEQLPRSQTIVVTHHDGGVLPINGICFGVAWYEHFGFNKPLYVLTHELLHNLWSPFTKLLSDSGCMPADRSAMDAVLSTGQSVLVFPGAARESFRTYWDREKIDLGGRKGFVAQAIRWGLPITPVVSAGSHETVVVLSGGHDFARRIGIPKLVRSADVMPVLAGLPWGIWALPFLPQIPLPAKITTEVLPPVHLSNELGRALSPGDADNQEIVNAGYEIVVGRMRKHLSKLYAERKFPILG